MADTIKPSVKDMLDGKENRYPLVIGIAKRAREISREIETKGEVVTEKPVLLAIDDFKNNEYCIVEPNINE